MPEYILTPIDGSEQSMAAVAYAATLFPDARHASIHVIDPTREWYDGPGLSGDWRERSQKRAAEYHERAERIGDDHGVQIEPITATGEPYREILEAIEEHGADHLCLGSTGKSLIPKVMFGSVAETILRRSTVPVTIVRNRSLDAIAPPESILVAVDGSSQSYDGLRYVLSEFPGASLHAVHAIDSVGGYVGSGGEGTYVEEEIEAAIAEGEKILDRAVEVADPTPIETHSAFGDAAETVTAVAREHGIDHIVVGSRGTSGMKRILIGSNAEKITRRASTPVTVVR